MAGADESNGKAVSPVVAVLERLDNFAHMIVAILLICMAALVLIHTCFGFVQPIVHIIPPLTVQEHAHVTPVAREAKPGEAISVKSGPGEGANKVNESKESLEKVDRFYHYSLDVLSSILYAVIILELLRTIITYLQTHNIQAIMQEFMVVGIISSVRKILLVGAESSLSGSTGIEFIQEATGTLILILGILLLIFGLVFLRRYAVPKAGPGASEL